MSARLQEEFERAKKWKHIKWARLLNCEYGSNPETGTRADVPSVWDSTCTTTSVTEASKLWWEPDTVQEHTYRTVVYGTALDHGISKRILQGM